MFKWLFRIIFAFFLFLVGFYIYTIRHPLNLVTSETEYFSQRQYVYSLIEAEEFDAAAFQEFIYNQAGFKNNEYPKELWWSMTFEDPRGGITVYHDTLMAMALGIKRMYDLDEPVLEVDKAVNNILNRRSYVWHDFKATNHYAREYAALAALAKTVGDTRYEVYQKKLVESVNELFTDEGMPLEGPSYGLYTIKMLAPYIYVTGDEELMPVIDKFGEWLSNVAAPDGSIPPFEDSPALTLPLSISNFSKVNQSFGDWHSTVTDELTTGLINETVFRRPNFTVWVRHLQNGNTFNMHRHFSSLDLMMKSDQHWWLIASGYPGYDKKFDAPYLQNIITHKGMLDNNWAWRVKGIIPGKKPVSEMISEDMWNYHLGSLDRKVTFEQGEYLVVQDQDARSFEVYWNIKGKLIDKQQTGEGYILTWEQDDEKLVVDIAGAQELQLLAGRHALNKNQIIDHTVVKIKGSKVRTTFRLE